jgi:hypothetical protein
MTRGELLERMSSQEITDWMALMLIRNEEREQQQREAKLRGR